MSKSLQEWIKQDLPALQDIPKKEYYEEGFFRDPIRPRLVSSENFYSPVDGTILYQKEVKADEQIVDIKGANYNIRDLIQDEMFNKECLVIGIFLNQYDVHIAKLPYTGILNYKRLEKIRTKNKPMLNEENDILRGIIDYDDLDYVFENERFLDTVICPRLNYKYYMVLIGDEEVDVVAHFHDNNKMLLQNERVCSIRFGSQCDLILPKPIPFNYKLLVPNYYHVEGGVDSLIRIENGKMA